MNMNNLRTFEEWNFMDPSNPLNPMNPISPLNPINPSNPMSPLNPINPNGFEQQRRRREQDDEDRRKRRREEDDEFQRRLRQRHQTEIEFNNGDKIMYENPGNHHDGETGIFLSIREDGKYRIRFDDGGGILAADPHHVKKY
jgi:hypothetical protein